VIAVIALLLVIGIPSGFLTAQIQERVERETGYQLAINGGAKPEPPIVFTCGHLFRDRTLPNEAPRRREL